MLAVKQLNAHCRHRIFFAQRALSLQPLTMEREHTIWTLIAAGEDATLGLDNDHDCADKIVEVEQNVSAEKEVKDYGEGEEEQEEQEEKAEDEEVEALVEASQAGRQDMS